MLITEIVADVFMTISIMLFFGGMVSMYSSYIADHPKELDRVLLLGFINTALIGVFMVMRYMFCDQLWSHYVVIVSSLVIAINSIYYLKISRRYPCKEAEEAKRRREAKREAKRYRKHHELEEQD